MNQIEDLGECSPKVAALSRRAALKGLAGLAAGLPFLLAGRKGSRWNAPAPKFNFGDRVSYSFPGDDDETITYEGDIMGMVYCPDDLELDCQFGKGWFYAVHWQVMPGCSLPHLFKQIDASQLEHESELRGIA